MKRIGEFFRENRMKTEMDAEAVVNELGLVSVTQLFEYESGSVQIPLEDLFAMSNLYNIPPDEVVRFLYVLSVEGAEDSSKEVLGR